MKKREKIHHQPSVHEVFYCIAGALSWAKLLLYEFNDKPYNAFLESLIEKQFYEDIKEKITIKKLASDHNITPAKATQWIFSIYEDINTLNEEKPELFCTNGYTVTLYMHHYDDYATFTLSLPAMPREFERISFDFIKAKVGIDIFWVKEVEHAIRNDSTDITIKLKGGFVNRYREYSLDKAEFQGWIGWRDKHEKYDFEIDEELRKLFK